MTAAGWVVVAAAGALLVLFFVRGSGEADRRATETKEVAREQEHLLAVNAWMRDTSANAAVPASAGRPVPTSTRAKRMWMVSRMLVDRLVWEREVMKRHGVGKLPAAWDTPRYQANARAYPEVGAYLEARAAALAELENTAAAWMEERVASLARESGMPAREVRDIFPSDFATVAPGEARLLDVMLEVHRHLVHVDPRVEPAGGNLLRYQREEDLRRLQALEAKMHDAVVAFSQNRERKLSGEAAALSRVIE